jgi:A/G-specific adenine glycosylase
MAKPSKGDVCVTPTPFDPVEIASRLLAWYGRAGRDLPWRNTRDPYRVWLSEIMLQQTTVAAVIPYYEQFLAHFPTIDTLARASLDDVITLWAGLGYYSRARNLHQAARHVVLERDGAFPDDFNSLMALPGVGRSTAGAILSIAFDKPAPILDGNVRRVLVRLLAWMDDPRSRQAEKQLWLWAEALTSTEMPHDYAQAIMDLGATVCTPREPKCDHCPLRQACQACQKKLTGILPVSRMKQKVPVRRQVVLIISSLHGILLRQRPPEGFLGGLWEFPTLDLSSGLEPEQAAARLFSDLLLHGKLAKLAEVRHAYSHFKLELTVFTAEAEPARGIAEDNAYRWCRGTELERLPLHGAHRKAYNRIGSES